VLISTYELGGNPSVWHLRPRAAGDGHEVTMGDVSCAPLAPTGRGAGGLIAFFLPMHTATRLFLRMVDGVRRSIRPRTLRLCLYAQLNEGLLELPEWEPCWAGSSSPA